MTRTTDEPYLDPSVAWARSLECNHCRPSAVRFPDIRTLIDHKKAVHGVRVATDLPPPVSQSVLAWGLWR